MTSVSQLRQQAASIASASPDSPVQQLAQIVEQLCTCVEYADREAGMAKELATRASHDAVDAKRALKK
jgi:hypothetical protein